MMIRATQVFRAFFLHPSCPQPKKRTAANAQKISSQLHIDWNAGVYELVRLPAKALKEQVSVSGANMTNQNLS